MKCQRYIRYPAACAAHPLGNNSLTVTSVAEMYVNRVNAVAGCYMMYVHYCTTLCCNVRSSTDRCILLPSCINIHVHTAPEHEYGKEQIRVDRHRSIVQRSATSTQTPTVLWLQSYRTLTFGRSIHGLRRRGGNATECGQKRNSVNEGCSARRRR